MEWYKLQFTILSLQIPDKPFLLHNPSVFTEIWVTPLKKDVCSTIHIPFFGRDEIVNRAKTVDVIWFNERKMPNSFFEVEHSTDIQNSVAKFCDLQDFHRRFLIIAPQNRKKQFEKVMSRTAFR